MKDGLYRVVRRGVVAGFVVEGGRVVRWAPWLDRRRYLFEFGEWICP